MKSLNNLKKTAYVGVSSLVLAAGLLAAPAAFADGGGRGEHRGDRGHRENRGDRREGDRHERDRHEGDRDWRWGDRHGEGRDWRFMNWGDRDED